MKKFIKVNLIILVIFFNLTINVFAEENIEQNQATEKISNEEKVDELKEQKQELENQTSDMSEQLHFVSDELSNTVLEISELTQNIYNKQTEIQELTAKLQILETRIQKVQIELNESNAEYKKQKELLEKRLVAMYEMGETSYLDLMLNSKNISDFLSNYYYISEIATTDAELFEIIKEQKAKVENLMTNLQKNQSEFESSKSKLEKTNIALSNMVIIKNQKLETLNEEEMSLQAQIEEYQAQIQAVESEIRILSLSNDNSEYVGGTFSWPVPGYTRISSPFGMRTHPITGIYKLHTGTDISAPMGAIFVASNDGLVTKAGYNSAYGNMVIVDHGGGISTLYAHGSEILVEVGQTVTKGTPVLKVGSTGYSTGPHAHFEIRTNGNYVNPLDYLQNNTEENESSTQTVELQENTN